jgi:hypothetical protein
VEQGRHPVRTAGSLIEPATKARKGERSPFLFQKESPKTGA